MVHSQMTPPSWLNGAGDDHQYFYWILKKAPTLKSWGPDALKMIDAPLEFGHQA